MSFQKGQSGNPDGKPKGLNHKKTQVLRDTINKFLNDEFDQIKKDWMQLSPKDRGRLYCDLLQYGIPKLQAIENTIDFGSMSDEQLNQIIEGLKAQSA